MNSRDPTNDEGGHASSTMFHNRHGNEKVGGASMQRYICESIPKIKRTFNRYVFDKRHHQVVLPTFARK